MLSTVSCPPVAVRGAVSGRVAAATPVRLACASRSLGRLALVALTCLPAAASVSIYTILSRPLSSLPSPPKQPPPHRSPTTRRPVPRPPAPSPTRPLQHIPSYRLVLARATTPTTTQQPLNCNCATVVWLPKKSGTLAPASQSGKPRGNCRGQKAAGLLSAGFFAHPSLAEHRSPPKLYQPTKHGPAQEPAGRLL